MPDQSVTKTNNPCRGWCTTALGDEVCKGCGRTFEEVKNWNTYSEEQKTKVIERLNNNDR